MTTTNNNNNNIIINNIKNNNNDDDDDNKNAITTPKNYKNNFDYKSNGTKLPVDTEKMYPRTVTILTIFLFRLGL
jgi:hypothetical protein